MWGVGAGKEKTTPFSSPYFKVSAPRKGWTFIVVFSFKFTRNKCRNVFFPPHLPSRLCFSDVIAKEIKQLDLWALELTRLRVLPTLPHTPHELTPTYSIQAQWLPSGSPG